MLLIAAVVYTVHEHILSINLSTCIITFWQWTFHHISILFDNKPFRSVLESNWITAFQQVGFILLSCTRSWRRQRLSCLFVVQDLCFYLTKIQFFCQEQQEHMEDIPPWSFFIRFVKMSICHVRYSFFFFFIFFFKRSTWAINCFLYRCLVHSLVTCTVLYDLIFIAWYLGYIYWIILIDL